MSHPAQNVTAPRHGHPANARNGDHTQGPIRAEEHRPTSTPAPASTANRPTPAATRAGGRGDGPAACEYAPAGVLSLPRGCGQRRALSGNARRQSGVVVQGLGNVGYHGGACSFSTEDGCKDQPCDRAGTAPSEKHPRGLDIRGLARTGSRATAGSGIAPLHLPRRLPAACSRHECEHPHFPRHSRA